LPQVGQQRGGEGPEGHGGGPLAVIGVDVEEEHGAFVEGLRVFGVQLAVGEEHAVPAEGVPAPARMRTQAGQVGVHVAVAEHGEEVVVDLEAELGGECEEGEGSFGRLASGSEVGARHIGSIGLGSSGSYSLRRCEWREGVGVI